MGIRIFDRYPVLEKVIVNTKVGTSFRAVLWERRGKYLMLRAVELLREKDGPVVVDGVVLVPADNVDFIQVVEG